MAFLFGICGVNGLSYLTERANGSSGSEFGYSVSISDEYAVVGAIRGGSGGNVNIHKHDSDVQECNKIQTLNGEDSNVYFGQSVAIYQNCIIARAKYSVHIFKLNTTNNKSGIKVGCKRKW